MVTVFLHSNKWVLLLVQYRYISIVPDHSVLYITVGLVFFV